MDKVKELLHKLKDAMLRLLFLPLQVFARALKLATRPLVHPVTVGLVTLVLGFIIGARLHEVGYLANKLGKDYKGSTVYLSGLCNISGSNKPRLPAFAEDEVKVTSIDGERLLGIVRLTRESIECKLADVAIDKLPLLANLAKSPAAIPELQAPVIEKKDRPAYKDYEKKTLLMSGSCVNMKNEVLPAFTDETVDITSVDPSQECEDLFVFTGIKKKDQEVVRCLSNSVKYEVFQEKALVADNSAPAVQEGPVSSVGEVILITGSCFPDQRTNLNKKSKIRALYKLANTRVEVLEERLDKDGKISYLAGTVMDEPYRTEQVVCDKTKIPFIYKDYDPEGMKLDSKISPENNDSAPAAEAVPAPSAE